MRRKKRKCDVRRDRVLCVEVTLILYDPFWQLFIIVQLFRVFLPVLLIKKLSNFGCLF